MVDVTFGAASAAYKAANRGDKILEKTSQSNAFATPQLPGRNENSDKVSFGELVGESLRRSASVGYNGESVSAKSVANEADLHELVTAVANAELTLQTVVGVRDRVINAYNDIIKMPV